MHAGELPVSYVLTVPATNINGNLRQVVKVRGNAGKRRSWAPKNCRRAFPGPTQALVVQTGCEGPLQLTVGSQLFSELLGSQIYTLTTGCICAEKGR